MAPLQRSWSQADKAYLIRRFGNGATVDEMAEHFKVSRDAIHQMRYRLGLTKQQSRRNALAVLEDTVKITGKNKETGFTAYRNLTYCALGISGEAGEVADQVKKILRNDNGVLTSERKESILAEVGDVLWYCQAIILALHGNIDDVIQKNQDKLFARMQSGEINERGRSGTSEPAE